MERNIEKRILSHILLERQVTDVMKSGVTSDYFNGTEKLIFQFIVDYWQKYQAVPDVNKVQHSFPNYEFYAEVKEPIRALLDDLKDYYIYNTLSKIIKEGVDLLQKDTKAALSYIGANVANIKTSLDGRDTQWSSFLERKGRVEAYQLLKKLGVKGIPSFFKKLNEFIARGFHNEQLIFVVGRPTTGKTWWLCLNALQAWRKGQRVLFVTREMSNSEICRRMDALRFKLPYGEFVTAKLDPKMEQDYTDQMLAEEDLKEFLVTSDGFTTYSLYQKIMEFNPDIVFVDGVYLMEIRKNESKTEAIYRTTGELKQMAKEFRVPIIGSTQMSRGTYGGRGGKDRLAQISWGDAFGQDSDVCIELVYDEKMAKAKTMWHHIIKNREGASGVSFASFWDFENMEFRCLEGNERPGISEEETKKIMAQEEGDTQGIKILKLTAD